VEIGIMARTFVRPDVDATLDAVAAHGLRAVQFNVECAGLDDMPAELPDAVCDAIAAAHGARGITLAALSGTVNMIHPDPARRADGLARLRTLIAACPRMGARVVTLCTGTRDARSMWRAHPDNQTAEAWRDLTAALAAVLPAAEAHGVDLAVEPEVSNAIDSAARARRLLDEMRSPRLKICMDGANIFHAGELPRMAEILDEAFDLLGSDVVVAHAKDLDHDGEAGHLPAGRGCLDYGRYCALLRRIGYRGAVILHGLGEDQVDGCVDFLRRKLAG
jgi:sugar phosphate isomerase/epimerase